MTITKSHVKKYEETGYNKIIYNGCQNQWLLICLWVETRFAQSIVYAWQCRPSVQWFDFLKTSHRNPLATSRQCQEAQESGKILQKCSILEPVPFFKDKTFYTNLWPNNFEHWHMAITQASHLHIEQQEMLSSMCLTITSIEHGRQSLNV